MSEGKRYVLWFVSLLTILFFIGCAVGGVDTVTLKEVKRLYDKGETYLQEKKLDEAKSVFEKAVSLFPDHAKPHYGLAKMYDQKGEVDAALKEYEIALRSYPFDPRVSYDMAKAYSKKRDFDNALLRYKVALINSKQISLVVKQRKFKQDVFIAMGEALIEKSAYDVALLQLRRALVFNPLLSRTHYLIAKAYHRSGKVDDALKEYRKAVGMFYRLEEDTIENIKYFSAVYQDYAAALNEKGLTSQAEEQMEKYHALKQ